jgi:hypothetical protein
MALFGFRQNLIETNRDDQLIEAVELVIKGFGNLYPEFMIDGYETDSEVRTGVYHMDDRLQTYMDAIDKYHEQ